MWDVVFYDVDTGVAYRVQTKRLTVGDGVAVDSAQDAQARREDLAGRALLNMRHYPLLLHGTTRVECAALDEAPDVDADGKPVLPDDLPWEPWEFSEAAFLGMNELFMWAWLTAVVEKNPHRDQSYEALKKVWRRAMQLRESDAPTSASAPEEQASATT